MRAGDGRDRDLAAPREYPAPEKRHGIQIRKQEKIKRQHCTGHGISCERGSAGETQRRVYYEPEAFMQGPHQSDRRGMQRFGRIPELRPHHRAHYHGIFVPVLGHGAFAVYHCGIRNAGADGLNGAVKPPFLFG